MTISYKKFKALQDKIKILEKELAKERKYYETVNYINKLVKQTFGTEAEIQTVLGTWSGDKKTHGAGVDITWPVPKYTSITKQHRAIASAFIRKYISNTLKITLTSGNYINSYCIFISAREW